MAVILIKTPTGELGSQPSSFVFRWTALSEAGGNSGISRDTHSRFNTILSLVFPKILYSSVYSNYNDSWLSGADYVYATGETLFDAATTKRTLLQMLKDQGIRNVDRGITEFSQESLGSSTPLSVPKPSKPISQQISTNNGSNPNVINVTAQGYEIPKSLNDIAGNFAKGLGITTPIMILGLLLFIFLIRR